MSTNLFRFLLIAALFAGVIAIARGLSDVASTIRERNAVPVYADETN